MIGQQLGESGPAGVSADTVNRRADRPLMNGHRPEQDLLTDPAALCLLGRRGRGVGRYRSQDQTHCWENQAELGLNPEAYWEIHTDAVMSSVPECICDALVWTIQRFKEHHHKYGAATVVSSATKQRVERKIQASQSAGGDLNHSNSNKLYLQSLFNKS